MPRRSPTDIENIDLKWHVLKLLWPYLLEFKGRVSLTFFCLALAKASSICLPFLLKYIVDDMNAPAESSSVNPAVLVPVLLILCYGLARFMNVMFNEIRDTLFGRVTERTIRRISLETFRHLHRLDLDFHLNRRTGGLARDIERGSSGINFLMRFMIFNILPTILELLIVMAIFLINYGLSFMSIIFFAIFTYVIYSVYATEKRTRFVRAMNEADSASSNRSIDSLLNYETVKYFTNEDYEAEHYDTELETWEAAKRNNRYSLFALNGGQALIVSVSMTVMLLLAAKGVSDGTMTLGDFVLVNSFMMQLFIPLNFLGFVYREIKGALANIEKLFDLLAVKPKVVEVDHPVTLDAAKPSVKFDHVGFSYREDRKILNNLSFSIAPGEKVAIVGSSGSGKSTIVKLLFRFYDCQQGSISINEQNIRNLSLSSLRGAIGIVPQDTVLFNDTIVENIRYGKPGASDEEILEVIKLAHLEDFIAQLPDGEQTIVGERGLKVSGGEKQRIAIARTMLKNPSILVFDEATSSLDSKTESVIIRSLNEIAQGRTSLVIAHRLSTVVDADRILVMEQGAIVETGKHLELLEKQGVYHHLWEIQQKQQKQEAQQIAADS